MEIKIARTTEDLDSCYKLREIVFVQEQNVPIEEEKDELDKTATHFLLVKRTVPIGTARVVAKGNKAKIGRFCILKEHRKNGAGLFFMKEIMDYCKKQNFKKISLSAQEHALGFYEKLGFKICSEKYIDANIPHFDMWVKI